MAITEILLLTIVLLTLYYHLVVKRRAYPPGPIPLPFIGNLLQINFFYPQRTFRKWYKQYGGLYTIWVGPLPFVILAEYNLMKRYLCGKDTSEAFAGRAKNYAIQYFVGGNHGIINSERDVWREQRRFTLHVLRDLGFGRQEMEPKILLQVKNLMDDVRSRAERSTEGIVSLGYSLELAIGNVISSVLIGRTFPEGCQEFAEMRRLDEDLVSMFTGPRIFLLLTYPWLRHLPVYGRFGFNYMTRMKVEFWAFFRQLLAKYKENQWVPEREIHKDFTGIYLQEIERRKDETGHNFNDQQLRHLLADFMLAGMDTTKTTMEWGMLYLIHNPEVQDKIQMELDIYMRYQDDPKRHVEMKDRANLPYTAAALMELQRMTNILPINLQHCLTRDTMVEGYNLPEGTAILPQISVVLCDEQNFPEPDVFEPLRFLDENGNKLKRVEEWTPFGMGKRQCAGESLARMQLWMMFANLCRNFRFSNVPGKPPPSLRPQLKFTRSPQPYECHIALR